MPRPTRSLSVVLCVCCIAACFEYVYAQGISTLPDCPINETPDGPSTCVPCEAGTNKDTVGSEACTPDGWRVADVGAKYLPFDVAGGLDQYGGPSTISASGCAEICDEMMSNGITCYAFFIIASGSTPFCAPITRQDWNHGVPNDDRVADDHTTTYERITCNAGYTGIVPTCTACDSGKYKATAGLHQCTECPLNSVANGQGQTECMCNSGYTGPDSGTCVPCDAGTYKDTVGSEG